MKKRTYTYALLLIGFFMVSSIIPKMQVNHTPKQDPNIIHIVVPAQTADDPTEQIKKALNPRPDFNPFNATDQMIIDRKTNTFYLYLVSEEAADAFEHESNMMAANGVKEITIDLHSPGGQLVAAAFITQQMKILNEKGIKIKTIVEDKNACASACPIIFLAGNEKIAFANSVFMFHSPYIKFPYNTPENVMIEMMRELRVDRDDYAKMLKNSCPADNTIQMFVYDHEDHFLTAKDLSDHCPGTFFDSIIPVIDHPDTNKDPLNQ